MDRERLFRVIGEKYIARNELYGYLPLGVNADEIWCTVLEQRRAKAITLPLTNANGVPYWYTLTDRMIIASENIVNELYENDYTDKLLSSVMTIREIFFTGYLEGSQISAQEAVSFLQRGEEALDAEELMILNNRQAGSFAAENIYRPLNKDYLQVLAQILTNGLDNGGGELRTEDSVDIYFMQGESYVLPSAARLNGCINEITTFLADMNVHPLIKAAVAQAWAMVVRPFPDGNERLGRLLSEIILIRSGYTFFGEESISEVIAKSGFKYFDAIAKIVRGANGNDLTYFLDYYLSVLSDFVDEIRDKRKKKDTESIEAEREMARSSLAPSSVEQNSSEAVSGETDDTIEGFDISDILNLIEQEYNNKYSDQKKTFLDILKNILLSGKDTFTSKIIESAANGAMPKKSISNYIQRLIHLGIVERYGLVDKHLNYRFKLQSVSIKSERILYTKNEIIDILSEFSSNTSENGKKINDIFLELINDGKYSFTSEYIRTKVEVTSYDFHHLLRKYKKRNIIEREGNTYSFCIKPETLTEIKYSEDIIDLIDELINSDKSSRKDKRIGSIIHSCLSRGVITAEDYEIIGEATKMNTDMAFAKQLGLVELLPDGNYEINKALKNSFNKIEKGTKNILSEMYSIFGDGLFSAEMVIAELNYSHSHTNATLHKLTWLKVLNCTIDEEKRYSYQFLITPEDHPECFIAVA